MVLKLQAINVMEKFTFQLKTHRGEEYRHTLISSKEVATTSGLNVHRYETQLKIVKYLILYNCTMKEMWLPGFKEK